MADLRAGEGLSWLLSPVKFDQFECVNLRQSGH